MKKNICLSDARESTFQIKKSVFLRISLLLGSSLLVMANAAIIPSLVSISKAFNTVFGVSLLMSFPAIAVVIFSPFVGPLINRYGERKALLMGLFLYALTGSSGLWCNSLYLLLFGRLLLGASISICMTVINHLIGYHFHGHERSRLVSQQSMAVNIGGIVFILLSGVLAELNWRVPFSLYLFSLPVLALAYISISDTPQMQHEDKITRRAIKPMLPAYVLGGVGMLIYYITLIHMPFVLSNNYSLSAQNIGLIMAIMGLISAFAALFNHRLKIYIGEAWLLAFCFVCLGTALIPYVFLPGVISPVISIICAGMGFGILLPTLTGIVIERSPVHYRPQLLSGFVMSYFLGQALSAPLMQSGSVYLSQSIFMFSVTVIAYACAFIIFIRRHTISRGNQ
ncbi:MFS transporter [Buttiauxella sp. B2]|uniref:MFS transporter n=1 Tax=Buttiauxella sp. B2 TaxID=2587812 RepID=UPI00111ECF99|nr:MFS transporter [Buttiauxella sp. B2]TNV20878.1 MFS transporter [Buttiauxella sp. B2]